MKIKIWLLQHGWIIGIDILYVLAWLPSDNVFLIEVGGGFEEKQEGYYWTEHCCCVPLVVE